MNWANNDTRTPFIAALTEIKIKRLGRWHTACIRKFILLSFNFIFESFGLAPGRLYLRLHLLSTQIRHGAKPVPPDELNGCGVNFAEVLLKCFRVRAGRKWKALLQLSLELENGGRLGKDEAAEHDTLSKRPASGDVGQAGLSILLQATS